MKRPLLAILVCALFSLVPPAALLAQESPLSWVNDARRAAGAAPVAADALLSETARRWAETLAKAGVLSHRGADGSSGLDRYRALGGTDAHVGEILGAGPTLGGIETGWMKSDEHRMLMLSTAWTHVGWGRADRGTAQVWVVLFCEKLVDGLVIEERPDGLSVSGRFTTSGASAAFLSSGVSSVAPLAWDAATRRFSFLVPDRLLEPYLRLGFVTPAGARKVTNTFTLPRGTELRADPDRFAAPAAPP